MLSIRCLLATALFLAGSTLVADAQVHLHGRVIDDTSEEPIAGAVVDLINAHGFRLQRRITDEWGQFSFSARGSGPVRLRAERLGYRATTSPPLHFDGYQVYSLELRLDVEAVLLAPLEVVTRAHSAGSPTLAGFHQRRQTGVGWYMTREQIEQRKASRLSDILAMVPGVSVRRSIVYMRRPNCPAQVFVDGFHINRSPPLPRGGRLSTTEMFPIDQVVQPGAVEGIEVYQGLSRVPAEFLSPEAACGVVAIWTRRGA
jgi:hypothetical protein